MTVAAALHVIVGKTYGASPIMSLILFDRASGIGHTMCGLLHSFTEKSNEIFRIQKVFKILDVKGEDKT